MKKACLFLTALLSSYFLLAGNISGYVYDGTTREALVGAHVMLEVNWRIGSQTDTSGYFGFAVPDSLSDTLRVVVSYLGYEEAVVKAIDGAVTNIHLMSAMRTMSEVTISGSALIAEEFAVKTMNKLDIYKNPAAKADILLAVHTLPASTTLDESANISFRGGSPAQTGIFFNSVPAYDGVRFSRLNGIGTFSVFNTEMVDKVIVFPGNPPLEYGNVSSGLIAVETSDKLPQLPTTTCAVSLANIGLQHNRRLAKNTAITAYSNYQPSAALQAFNREALADIASFESLDFGMQLLHKGSNGSQLKVFHYGLWEGYDVHFSSPTYQGLYAQSRMKSMTIANYLHPVKHGVLRLDAGYTVTDMDAGFSRAALDQLTRYIYGAVSYQRDKKRSGIKAGLTYDVATRRLEGIVPRYDFAIGKHHPFDALKVQNSRTLLEPYAMYKYMPSDMISFGYALRTNIPVDKGPAYLSHQSNIRFDPRGAHEVKLSRGVQHQLVLSEEENAPILYRSAQFSLDHTFESGKIQNTNAAFRRKTKYGTRTDLVHGIEASMKYTFDPGSFLEVSYTGLNVQARKGDQRIDSPFDLHYFVRLHGQYTLADRWTLGIRGLFRQGSFFTPVNDAVFHDGLPAYRPLYAREDRRQRLPAYNTLDLNLSRMVSLSQRCMMVVFGSVSNVFDFDNVRGYSYNFDYSRRTAEHFSRRTVYIGIQMHMY